MIADASVLILFARVGRLELLRGLFATLLVPSPVLDEVFAKGPAAADVRAVLEGQREGWIRTAAVPGHDTGSMVERFPRLGLGEAACLCLAIAQRDSILLDDSDGRSAARFLGVRAMGSLGVLRHAHLKGLLTHEEVAEALRQLLAAGLWVGADIVERFWEIIGGRP